MHYLIHFFLFSFLFGENYNGFVTAEIEGQLGNNMFNIAAASALAWDHGAVTVFPDLPTRFEPNNPANASLTYQHILFRCPIELPRELKGKPVSVYWHEPSFRYHEIPFQPNMKIEGYFQSEKYFARHREKILDLFAPHPDDLIYIFNKYREILDHPCTVGIQIRELWDDAHGERYMQYGKDFIRKAARFFPDDSLFIITSNDIDFAKQNIPEEMHNYILIEREPHYIDFNLLRLCKHLICPNSTFGWWAAWLNENPNKIIVTPKKWAYVTSIPTEDLLPDEWMQIDANHGPRNKPETYQ